MRLVAFALLAAGAAMPAPIIAQDTAPTADDYVCALTDECEEASEAEAEQAAAPATNAAGGRLSATRRFTISTPVSRPAQPPAARPGRAQTPRQASATNRRTRPAAAAARRVDLRLSFGIGSAELSPAGRQQIQIFAEALKRPQLANVRVRIEGHTDSSGSRMANVSLSQRRAQSVADFLVSEGVPAARLDVKGYGPDRPLGGRSAASPANRRVEAVRIS